MIFYSFHNVAHFHKGQLMFTNLFTTAWGEIWLGFGRGRFPCPEADFEARTPSNLASSEVSQRIEPPLAGSNAHQGQALVGIRAEWRGVGGSLTAVPKHIGFTVGRGVGRCK